MASPKKSLIKCKKIRNKLDLLQEQFGRLVGVSQATVHRWEDTDQVPKGYRDKLDLLNKDPDEYRKALKDFGIDAVSLILDSASKGQKNLYSGGGLCSGSIAKESIGLFKIGAKLFEAGGAYGAYQLLKKVFDEPDEPKKG
jgi:DNA-binding XRE family transcriptional regulator